MKTEKDINKELNTLRENLVQVTRQFNKYDNHHDLETIQQLGCKIRMLEWVLD